MKGLLQKFGIAVSGQLVLCSGDENERSGSMNQKAKLGLILGGVIFILVIFSVISALMNRIPQNPAGTEGNTTGNLYNQGLFCESDGKVYFSNSYDGGALYSMNVDESDVKKLHGGGAKYINAGGDYLYYWQSSEGDGKAGLGYIRGINGLYRIKNEGSKPRAIGLSQKAVGYVKLVDNTVYYQHEDKETGVTLHQIGTDKKGDEMLIDKNIPPLATYQNKIYYSGFEKDHNLYAIDLASGASGMVLQANMCYPTVEGGYLYYMDIDVNYRLCRIDLNHLDAGALVLTNDRVDTYNVYGNCIFYQKNSETSPALIRMNIDGTNPEVIAEGNYTNINCTSNYTYFQLFGQSAPVYKVSTNGGIQVTTFDAARDAALANQEK